MIEGILDGVSLALAEAFPKCTVYGDERVRQGLLTPSFFVGLGECRLRPLPGGLREQRQMVEVIYFPERQGDYGELWEVGPKALGLLGALRLPNGEMVRGMALRCDVNDGLMHIRAVYTLRLVPVMERGLMGDMRHRMGI
ncbi:MAG: hypothetical protein FWE12_04060 [Oscillospiraceae bacterium]|nr:hypothetical protein [Oscillospiraceae bacterium]